MVSSYPYVTGRHDTHASAVAAACAAVATGATRQTINSGTCFIPACVWEVRALFLLQKLSTPIPRPSHLCWKMGSSSERGKIKTKH